MQGYVTEILLTLEQAVQNLDVDVRPLTKDVFMSTPNLNNQPLQVAGGQAGPGEGVRLRQRGGAAPPASHQRSTSYNMQQINRRAVVSSPPGTLGEAKGECTPPINPVLPIPQQQINTR